MFRMRFFKKPKETNSRDIENKVDDGLSKLFDNNFRAVIKKMVYTAILSGESHFYIVVPDSDDPSKPPLKKGFPCLCYNFGEVIDDRSYFPKNINESRIISMK